MKKRFLVRRNAVGCGKKAPGLTARDDTSAQKEPRLNVKVRDAIKLVERVAGHPSMDPDPKTRNSINKRG
jgi:hypothetical protein